MVKNLVQRNYTTAFHVQQRLSSTEPVYFILRYTEPIMYCCAGELFTRERATSASGLGVSLNVTLSWRTFEVVVSV